MFLGLTFLRGGAAVVLLEHAALLEGVVDWGLVVRARFLQHIVEYVGVSRGRSRAFVGQVDCEGLVLVVVPLRGCLAAGLLALLGQLVLLLGLLGLAALRGRIIHVLALLAVKDGPHRLLAGSKTSGNVEQLIGVDRRAAPELVHKIPAGGALEKGVHDLGMSYTREFSTALGKASYEVLVHARRSHKFPGRTYVL
jgi:hypothetical protein